MAYIGPEPNPGQNREVDDISSGFNGSEVNFTLQVNSQNVSPGSSNAIIVSLGGVIQNPGTDYTVAASTLTFTTAPASGLAFFGLVLGQSIDTQGIADDSIGALQLQANTVTTAKIADSTGASDGVTTAKIATSAITTAKIADQAVDLSKLPHGTGSNDGKFLRANNGADPSFESVPAGGTTIPSGTVMLFQQTNAPTGFTKITTHNNKALRLVSGSPGTGGSNTFSAAFNSSFSTSGGSVSNHTLSISQIPAHNHSISTRQDPSGQQSVRMSDNPNATKNTNNTGGGGSHNHGFTNPSLNLDVQYVDVIMASKD